MIVGATERQNIERVFAGEQLADGHPLAGVARYLDAVRTTCGARPAPAPRSDLAAVLRSGGAPAGRSVAESARSRPGRVRRVVAIAATLAVSLGATGGLAAASALPDSVQRAVADLADHFGVHLPQPELPTPTVGGGAAADRGLNSSPVQVQVTTPTTTPDRVAATTSTAAAPSTALTSPPPTVAGPLPEKSPSVLPNTGLPALPSVPSTLGVDPLLPECGGNWLGQATHLCRAPSP